MPYPSENGRSEEVLSWTKLAERALNLFESRFLPAIERIAAALEQNSGKPQESNEVAEERRLTIQTLQKKIQAAREANDPTGVLELRADLELVRRGENLDEFDRSLAQWLISAIHRRIKTGRIAVEVVILAGRVAEQFATTKDGASLKASLPTLRRSVGLCSRCEEPYRGVEDACPKCLGPRLVPSAPTIDDLPKDDPAQVMTDIPPPFHEFD